MEHPSRVRETRWQPAGCLSAPHHRFDCFIMGMILVHTLSIGPAPTSPPKSPRVARGSIGESPQCFRRLSEPEVPRSITWQLWRGRMAEGLKRCKELGSVRLCSGQRAVWISQASLSENCE